MMNKKQRVFSIELNKREDIKNITLANGGNDNVVIEGTIGVLVEARFEEGVLLQVVGTEGVLRVDLCEDDIKEENSE